MQAIKLDLGAGEHCEDGFTPIDRKMGKEVYPLSDYADNSVDEEKASHVLEHFGNREVDNVLREWVRALKPGGRIRIAVPDCEYVCKKLLAGNPESEPLGSYLMGGQLDDNDYHRSIFNKERLTNMMEEAGLEKIQPWVSTNGDCSRLPVSLNLEGVKGAGKPLNHRPLPAVAAVMSMPRLAFSDNMFCALQVATELRLPFKRYTGAFWGQCLERAMEEYLTDGAEFILTCDYDTVFTAKDVRTLLALIEDNPQADAICPLQVKREEDCCILGLMKEDGSRWPRGEPVPADLFQNDLIRLFWGHFGLTVFRVSALRDLPHPWFMSVPNAEGKWGEGRLDDDLYFWDKWTKAGRTLYLANRVPVGHAQLMISWPSAEGKPVHQYPTAFTAGHRPEGVWR